MKRVTDKYLNLIRNQNNLEKSIKSLILRTQTKSHKKFLNKQFRGI